MLECVLSIETNNSVVLGIKEVHVFSENSQTHNVKDRNENVSRHLEC